MRCWMSACGALLLSVTGLFDAGADIFEHGRPADTALRESLADDRRGYYFQTSGIDHQENEERVSQVGSLGSGQRTRPSGLSDMDKAFDIYLKEQLRGDKDYRNAIGSGHPLVLLEYASPVLADVLKHYRMTSYERLAIDQARLGRIEGASESGLDRLARQAERGCLARNESRGLVAAMRLCQGAGRPFEGLESVDGAQTLEDGRRKVHVVAESLARLGLDRGRIDDVVELSGERVISNDSAEERLPSASFERKAAYARQVLVRKWREAYEKFSTSGRAGAARLEELSLPGVPVMGRTLADLALLDEGDRAVMIYRFSSLQAFLTTGRDYRQAIAYLDLCLGDPLLAAAYRGILSEKREFLARTLVRAEKDRGGLEEYKELFAGLGLAADAVRARLRQRVEPGARHVSRQELMLDR